MADFTHQPLDSSKPTIRVLQLAPSSKKDDIRCTLKHIDLEEDTYVCLSYMWGNPQPTHTMYINDQPFEVGHSLWMFLRRARKQKIRDWLWIDAICINQRDMAELQQQVRLMGSVYGRAKHVLVYPGEVPWNIELTARFVRLFRTKNKDYVDSTAVLVFMNVMLFCLVGRFPRWEYWTRMWVVQEIILAKTAFLVLRNGLLDLQYFTFAFPFLGNDLGPAWETPAWKIVDLRHSWATETPPKPGLSELIRLTSGAECQKQNDRIYALLGLLPKELSDGIVIDYDREWSLVVLDALQIVRSGVLSLTTELDMLEVFEGIQVPLFVLCGECAKFPEHAVRLPDGRVIEPISELMDEDQDIFWLSGPGSVVPECSRSRLPRSEIGWRPVKPVVCSCCAVELLSDYSLHLTLSRPVDTVLCGKARERGHQQGSVRTSPATEWAASVALTAIGRVPPELRGI